MKSYDDLLKFYGVEEGCLYTVTKAKKQEDKPIVGSHFTVKPRFKPDELRVVFEKGVSYNISILNDLEYCKASVLDMTEKRYLKNIIKPFKNRVLYIVKHSVDCSGRTAFIIICLKSNAINRVDISGEQIYLPYFKSETMYKGMALNKRYTLAELGLV